MSFAHRSALVAAHESQAKPRQEEEKHEEQSLVSHERPLVGVAQAVVLQDLQAGIRGLQSLSDNPRKVPPAVGLDW